MDIIEKARELGKLIQEDQRYIKTKEAQKQVDDDEVLQNLIGEFNLKKLNINNETMKQNKDQEKIKSLDKELSDIYQKINSNEKILKYESTANELNKLVNHVCTIITQSSQGEDPYSIDVTRQGCSGNCASCSGCH